MFKIDDRYTLIIYQQYKIGITKHKYYAII